MKYISESDGTKTGVFIPLKEWKKLKEKFRGLEEELENEIYSLSDEQNEAIDLALNSLNQDKGILHESVVKDTELKYANLFKK